MIKFVSKRPSLWLACIAATLISCTVLQQFARPPLVEGFELRGDIARVAGLAMNDLMSRLRQEMLESRRLQAEREDGGVRADGGAPSGENDGGEAFMNRLWACMSRPESYDVHVTRRRDTYFVRVEPVQERCVESGRLVGGAARYEIDARDFEVRFKEYEE